MNKTLVIGAAGQIGTELVEELRARRGVDQVIASDIQIKNLLTPCYELDATDPDKVRKIVQKEGISEVYNLVAMLSAKGEKEPQKAWDLNMKTLFIILDLAREGKIKKIFWPSSIAVFGPSSNSVGAPQYGSMEPTTSYGISKLAGELWCQYYFQNYGVDIRSIRYPGLISWRTMPGGGTTDYAIEIFHSARRGKEFISFLGPETRLPMMYMEDAVRAAIQLMEADSEMIKIRTSYNLAAVDFTPAELFEEIRKFYPGLKISYDPDLRQNIADSWPDSINDSHARQDWGWNHQFDLKMMVKDMVNNV
ncbi:MAG: NAD-dependent epimerase [Cryomorphaceae bacterium]|nr:NAD-dependent epimerase [Cryomorphaceae bacterium]